MSRIHVLKGEGRDSLNRLVSTLREKFGGELPIGELAIVIFETENVVNYVVLSCDENGVSATAVSEELKRVCGKYLAHLPTVLSMRGSVREAGVEELDKACEKTVKELTRAVTEAFAVSRPDLAVALAVAHELDSACGGSWGVTRVTTPKLEELARYLIMARMFSSTLLSKALRSCCLVIPLYSERSVIEKVAEAARKALSRNVVIIEETGKVPRHENFLDALRKCRRVIVLLIEPRLKLGTALEDYLSADVMSGNSILDVIVREASDSLKKYKAAKLAPDEIQRLHNLCEGLEELAKFGEIINRSEIAKLAEECGTVELEHVKSVVCEAIKEIKKDFSDFRSALELVLRLKYGEVEERIKYTILDNVSRSGVIEHIIKLWLEMAATVVETAQKTFEEYKRAYAEKELSRLKSKIKSLEKAKRKIKDGIKSLTEKAADIEKRVDKLADELENVRETVVTKVSVDMNKVKQDAETLAKSTAEVAEALKEVTESLREIKESTTNLKKIMRTLDETIEEIHNRVKTFEKQIL